MIFAKVWRNFKGQGTWSLEQLVTSGTLSLREFGWQDDQINLKKANINADYSVSDRKLNSQSFRASCWSGTIAGDVQIDNWQNHTAASKSSARSRLNEDIAIVTATRPPQKSKNQKEKASELQTGVVHLRLRDISARRAGCGFECKSASARTFSSRRICHRDD